MQTITYDLPRLLKLIKDNKFQIPQFQRPFRWRTGQIKLLLDSLVRGYPIGSLLVMGKNSEMPLKVRTIDTTILTDDSGEEPDTSEDSHEVKDGFIVLDGQQRITSIARIFLNCDPKRSYYIDLNKMLETFEDEGDVSDDLPWIKSYNKGKSDPERKNNNRWIRADIILDAQKASIYTAEYIEDSEDYSNLGKPVKREKIAKLGGLFEVVRKYLLPIVVIDADVGIDSVCRVFETINSTGTRLTTFDLAVARFFPRPDLRQLLNGAQDRYPILREFQADGDRILQVLALSSGYKHGRTPEPSRSGLLTLDGAYIEDNWNSAAEALQAAYSWAKGQGARIETLPNSGVIVSVAGMLFHRPNVLADPTLNFSSTLRRWYFSRVLREGASGGANTRMAADFLDLIRHFDTNAPLDFPNVLLTVTNIVNLTSAQDNRFKALQCILAIYADEDLLTQAKITESSELEHHHIFPRAFGKKHKWGSRVDSIANLISISKKSNRAIADREPREYLGELSLQAAKNGTQPDLKRRLDKSLIPYTESVGSPGWSERFALPSFDHFLSARAQIIRQKINEIIGQSLIDQDASDLEDNTET